MKIAVIGDTFLDCQVEGRSTRKSPEDSNCLILNQERASLFPGGAGNIAVWLAADARHEVHLFSKYASDACGALLADELDRKQVLRRQICSSQSHPDPHTTVKTRFCLIEENGSMSQLLRVDHDCIGELQLRDADYLIGQLREEGFEAIVVADYDKYLFRGQTGAYLIERLDDFSFEGVPLFVNSKVPRRWADCGCLMLVCNRAERNLAWPEMPYVDRTIDEVMAHFLIVTMSSMGTALWPASGENARSIFMQPSQITKEDLVDVTGAGDAFTAGLVLGYLRDPFDYSKYTTEQIREILACAQELAAHCCRQRGVGEPQTLSAWVPFAAKVGV